MLLMPRPNLSRPARSRVCESGRRLRAANGSSAISNWPVALVARFRRGPFARAGSELDDVSAFGVMNFFLARAGVAAGFGVAAGADHGDAERDQPIAQLGWFARGEDEANIGEHQAKRADELHEIAIGHVGERLKFSRAWAQARQGNGHVRFPAIAQKIIRMRRHTQRFITPIGQSEQRADAQSSKTRGIRAFRGFGAPVKISLRPGGVHFVIDRAVVGFLINHETFRPACDEWAIFFGFHRPNFERNAGNFLVQRAIQSVM